MNTAATASCRRTYPGPIPGRLGTSSPTVTETPAGRTSSDANHIGYDRTISVEWEDAGMDGSTEPRGADFIRSMNAITPPARRIRRDFSSTGLGAYPFGELENAGVDEMAEVHSSACSVR